MVRGDFFSLIMKENIENEKKESIIGIIN